MFFPKKTLLARRRRRQTIFLVTNSNFQPFSMCFGVIWIVFSNKSVQRYQKYICTNRICTHFFLPKPHMYMAGTYGPMHIVVRSKVTGYPLILATKSVNFFCPREFEGSEYRKLSGIASNRFSYISRWTLKKSHRKILIFCREKIILKNVRKIFSKIFNFCIEKLSKWKFSKFSFT